MLLLLCETSCLATARAGFTCCGARTRDHRREATLLLLLLVAIRCCCCCGLGICTHTRASPVTSVWRLYILCRGTHQQASQQVGPDIYRLTVAERRLRETQLATPYILLQRGFTALPARCWTALYGIGCLSVRAAKAVSLCVSRDLSACFFHVSACGAIIAVATTNSRRLSQQNLYKTCISLVELGRTPRRFIVHFEIIPT